MGRLINLALTVAMVTLSGCGADAGPERIKVDGTVNLNGEPMKAGSIRLVPDTGSNNPLSMGTIENGKFTIDNVGGVAVGDYQVEILSYRTETRMEEGEKIENRIQFLPPEYNKETSLKLSVPSGAEVVEAKFELKADPKKSY